MNKIFSNIIASIFVLVLFGISIPACADQKPVVSVVTGTNIDRTVRKAVDLLGGMNGRVKKGDRVIIKVSLDEAKPSGSGLVTNVSVVRALIKMAKEAGARAITVADGSLSGNTWKAFDAAGYSQMAKEENVQLKDLNADYIWRAWLPDGDNQYKKYSVSMFVLNCEVFINVPVMKVTNEVVPSLSLKNDLGIMIDKWTKRKLPKDGQLDQLIVDMNLIKQSDLVVIDGTSFGSVIVAGNDPVSTDSVAMRLMKIDPEKIGYLKLAESKGIGRSNESDIDIKSEKL